MSGTSIIAQIFVSLSKLFILCLSAYKRYGFVTVKLPKQYKNKEGVKISTIVFIQTIVLVSELTP